MDDTAQSESHRVGCLVGIMQQEGTYRCALADAASYQTKDNRLEVQDAAGKTTQVFVA